MRRSWDEERRQRHKGAEGKRTAEQERERVVIRCWILDAGCLILDSRCSFLLGTGTVFA